MAYFYRLVVVALFSFCCGGVGAADVPVSYKVDCGIGPGVGTSPAAACQAVPLGAGYSMSTAVDDNGNGDFYCFGGYGNETPHAFANCHVIASCPLGFLPIGNSTCRQPSPTCTLPAVLDVASNTCVSAANTCPKSGAGAGWWTGPGGTGSKSFCNTDSRTGSGDASKPGCTITGTSTFATGGHAPGGSSDSQGFQWGADLTYSGDKCAPGSGTSPTHDDGPSCTPPKVQGTVNGVVTCYTPSTSTPTASQPPPKTTTTSGPDGTKTETQTGTKTDCVLGICTTVTTVTTTSTPPGGTAGVPVTNTTTTTCAAGPGCSPVNLPPPTVVTTTTTPPPPGGTGGPATTTTTTTTAGAGGSSGGGSGGKGNGNGDGPDSAFGGVCGAPPACAGDAVLCAVAAATFATNCVLQDPKIGTPLYDAAIVKTGDQTKELAGNTTIEVTSSQFDQTEVLGAASGMTDRSITVMHSTVVLPFSEVNVWLARLGILLQAVTFLLCARVVIRG